MKAASTPLVSVCIPTYNRAERLARAVRHLLDSSYPALEILVSDNASTDETADVCAALAAKHPNVRYFRHGVNRGPTRNFEHARSMATGQYFLWHGDDDYLTPDFIARCVTELEKDPSLVLVSGLGAYHQGDHVVTHYGNTVQPVFDSRLGRALYFIWTVEEGSIFSGVYRRERVGGCEMPNCLAGDHVWLSEVLLEGKAKVLPDTFVYREEWSNTSTSMRNIVKLLELPRWNGTFPWLAIPHNLASNIAFKSAAYRRSGIFKKSSIYVIVYLISFVRQWISATIVRWRRFKKFWHASSSGRASRT